MEKASDYSVVLDIKRSDNVLLIGGNKNNFYNLNKIAKSVDFISKKNQIKNHILTQKKYSRIIINDVIFTTKKRLADIFLLNKGLICMFGLQENETNELTGYINSDVDYCFYDVWKFDTSIGECLVTNTKIAGL